MRIKPRSDHDPGFDIVDFVVHPAAFEGSNKILDPYAGTSDLTPI